MADKRMTEDEVVGRAALGHDHRHRRVGQPAQAHVARAGHPPQRPHRPHRRHLRRARRRPAVRRREGASGRSTPSSRSTPIPLEPHFRAARQAGAIEDEPTTRACSCSASRPRPGGCRSCPPGSGLGSDLFRDNPRLRTVVSPYPAPTAATARSSSPRRRCTSTPPSCTSTGPTPRGNAGFLGPDLYFDDLFVGAADAGASCRPSTSCPPTTSSPPSASPACASAASRSTASSRRPAAPTSPSCVPDYDRDEAFQKAYAASAKYARGVGRVPRRRGSTSSEADYQAKRPPSPGGAT